MMKLMLLTLSAAILAGCTSVRETEAPITLTEPVVVTAYHPLDCGANLLSFTDATGHGFSLFDDYGKGVITLQVSRERSKDIILTSNASLMQQIIRALETFLRSKATPQEIAGVEKKQRADPTSLTEREWILQGTTWIVDRLKNMKDTANKAIKPTR